MLNVIKRGKEHRHAAERLYAAVVTRSRQPVFFARLEVPDTLDGRFDLLTLHAWLVLKRYQTNAALAQAFVDCVFAGFDEALRPQWPMRWYAISTAATRHRRLRSSQTMLCGQRST